MAELEHLVDHASVAETFKSQTRLESSTTETTPLYSVPINAPEPSWFAPCAVIFVQLCALVLLVVAPCVPIWIQKGPDPLIVPSNTRLIYTTGLTVLASLVSALTSGQIRTLWLRKTLGSFKSEAVSARTRSKASVLVGQGHVSDNFKRWYILATFLIAGLTTSAIVAGLSFLEVGWSRSFNSLLALDYDNCLVINSDASDSGFSWELSNGSFMSLNISNNNICEIPQFVSSLLAYQFSPFSFDPLYSDPVPPAYLLGGVPIYFDALGIAFRLGNDLSPAFGSEISSQNYFQRSRNCLPVMSTNPVHCQVAGNVAAGQNNVSVSAGGCSISTPIYSVDPRTQGASAAGACTDGLQAGMATVVFGSVNDHAERLAQMMNDPTCSSPSCSSYSVACSINIGPAISFREVSLSLQNDTSVIDNSVYSGLISTFQVSADSNSSCVPVGGGYQLNGDGPYATVEYIEPGPLPLTRFLTDTALAVGASASWELLNENRYADGWWETLYTASSITPRNKQLGNWSQGHNGGLEVVLGIASSVALGMFWGNQDTLFSSNSSVYIQSGEWDMIGTRLGPGTYWSIVYILPSLFSILVLVYLLWVTRHELP